MISQLKDLEVQPCLPGPARSLDDQRTPRFVNLVLRETAVDIDSPPHVKVG